MYFSDLGSLNFSVSNSSSGKGREYLTCGHHMDAEVTYRIGVEIC